MPKRPDPADRAKAGENVDPEADYANGEDVPDPTAEAAEEAARKAGAKLDALRVGAFAGKAFELFERRRDGLDLPVPLPPKWGRVAAELRGGLWAGCYVLVGGTGVGKSQWAFEVAYHAVTRDPGPVPVLYVGLELDRAGVVARLTALGMHGQTANNTNGSAVKVPWSDLYLGNRDALAAVAGPVGAEVRGKLAAAPFYLVTGEALGEWSYTELPGLVAGLRARHLTGPALVIVDFLQLVGSSPGEREELRERIGKAAYAGRMVARKYGVSVLLLSATARGHYALFSGEGKVDGGSVQALGTGDPGRFLGTGKESGEVEYSADGVIALCRGSWTPGAPPSPVWLAVAKSRTGRAAGCTGWAELRFDGTSFAEPAAKGSGEEAKRTAKPRDTDA